MEMFVFLCLFISIFCSKQFFHIHIHLQVEYLIQWGATWESEVNLDCPDLVADYEQMHNKSQAGTKTIGIGMYAIILLCKNKN